MRLILMSATMNSSLFSTYFNGCPLMTVPGRMFEVNALYLEDVLLNTNYKSADMEQYIHQNSNTQNLSDMDELTLEAYYNSRCLKNRNALNEIDHELLCHIVLHIHDSKPTEGSILVFLPGYEDILKQKEMLEDSIKTKNYALFVLHSAINAADSDEQAKVFEQLPNGLRKIILSTNISETSVTIEDVVYVIDTGKVMETSYNPHLQSTCLSKTNISQDCAKQRAGRAGRTRNGFCYRLYSKLEYNALNEYTLPEILRMDLTEICLFTKMMAGTLSIKTYLDGALERPPLKHIEQSIKILKDINALDSEENISSLGVHLANLPVHCQLGWYISKQFSFNFFAFNSNSV